MVWLDLCTQAPRPGKEGGQAALQYLWVLEATDVGVQVELDACACPRQRQPTNQQHQQHSKRESGRKVDNLQGKEGFRGGLGHLLLLLNQSIFSKAGILWPRLSFHLLCDLGHIA